MKGGKLTESVPRGAPLRKQGYKTMIKHIVESTQDFKFHLHVSADAERDISMQK